jgi:hypothetical protein
VRIARLWLPIVAALALLPVGNALAGPQRAAAAPTLIKLIAVTSNAHETDKPPKGPSPGDRKIDAAKLYNGVAQFGKKAGQQVGTDSGVYVIRDPRTVYVSGTAKLPGGTLHFEGNLTVRNGIMSIPVVSGTGVFVGARGTLLVPVVAGGTKIVKNVYQLTYQAVA